MRIAQSEHRPPEFIQVALAHHHFGWIHPFSNGNGRVVRLLTYAPISRCIHRKGG